MLRNGISSKIIGLGVCLETGGKRVFVRRECVYDDARSYSLHFELLSKQDWKSYLCGELSSMQGMVKEIASPEQKVIEMWCFVVAFIDLCVLWMTYNSPTFWMASFPCFLFTICMFFPNFKNAQELMLDMYVNRYGGHDFSKVYKFRAAKNIVLNAYFDLKRIPTLEECSRYPMTDPQKEKLNTYYWGITYLITLAMAVGFGVLSVIVSLLINPINEKPQFLIRAVFLFLILIIIEFTMLSRLIRGGKCDFLEKYTLQKPHEEDIEMMICALIILETYEKYGIDDAEMISKLLENELNDRSSHKWANLKEHQ